jgi:hypothetical protein
MSIVGRIKDRDWYGEGGMEHLQTIKEPKQGIPTFSHTIELLMKVWFNSKFHPRYRGA